VEAVSPGLLLWSLNNTILAAADEMIRVHGFVLPPFAYWTPEEFKSHAQSARHIIDARCGWDITDYGAGRFDEMGLFLFTLRNGLLADLQNGGGMCYAEKLLITREQQVSPMHTHVIKAEDIINRGGATLVVELYGSNPKVVPFGAMVFAVTTSLVRNCSWRPVRVSRCVLETGTHFGGKAVMC